MKYLKPIFILTFSIALVTVFVACTVNNNKEIQVNSPDGTITVKVFMEEERLSYSVFSRDTPVLQTSSLGLTVDSVDLGLNTDILSASGIQEINDEYPLFGNHSVAQNQANEIKVRMKTSGKNFSLVVRAYNDGIALRYTIPEGTKYINRETTSWNIPEGISKIAWSEFNPSYEELSHVTTIEEVPQNSPVMGPLTLKTNSYYLSFSEADCEDFPDMVFIRNGNSFNAYFSVAEQGWELRRLTENNPRALDGTYNGEKVTPWRTTIIAKDLNELVNSDLITNVCPAPSKGSDFSWVKPGRCLWQWWSIGAPRYEDQKDWYDAAAKLKWEYYLIDDGWRYWKQPGKDQWKLLEEVIGYGKRVGVKSIVWVDSEEFRAAKERRTYLEKVKEIGADGIKIDFIPDPTAEIMQWYMGTMQDCAELKLLLNFHGSVKPTGLQRTYPNDITREAVRGNEYHMTKYNRVMSFDHDVCLPFTRLMTGPADVTPVMLNPMELITTKFTWAHEFAQAIVYLSPVTHFCDQYKFYLESPLFDLFQKIPTVWDETKVLPCTEMGEVVAYSRRKGDVWWIGIMNGANEREVTISFEFLDGTTSSTLVFDGEVSTSIDRKERVLSPNEKLKVHLIPGGGFVARLSGDGESVN